MQKLIISPRSVFDRKLDFWLIQRAISFGSAFANACGAIQDWIKSWPQIKDRRTMIELEWFCQSQTKLDSLFDFFFFPPLPYRKCLDICFRFTELFNYFCERALLFYRQFRRTFHWLNVCLVNGMNQFVWRVMKITGNEPKRKIEQLVLQEFCSCTRRLGIDIEHWEFTFVSIGNIQQKKNPMGIIHNCMVQHNHILMLFLLKA